MFTYDQSAVAGYRTDTLRAQARRDAQARAVAPRRFRRKNRSTGTA
jgi:hypothetical protein